MNKSKILNFFLLISLFTGYSCKTFETRRVLKKMDVNYEHLRENYIPNKKLFRSLSIPRLNVYLFSPEIEIGLQGNLRMVKDSAVFVRLNAGFGVELVRAMIEKEFIHVIDRINSSYEKLGLEQIRTLVGLDVNYRTIEAILFNGFTFNELISAADVDISRTNEYIVVYDRSSQIIEGFSEAKIFFRSTDLLVGRIEMVDINKGFFAYIDYSQFNDAGEGVIIPLSVELVINRRGELNRLRINYQKIEINTVKSISFIVPSQYQ